MTPASASFYQLCSCSLLSVRPHPVARRSEWARHLRTLEQDRLDELLVEPSSESSARRARSSSSGRSLDPSAEDDGSSSESQDQALNSMGGDESRESSLDNRDQPLDISTRRSRDTSFEYQSQSFDTWERSGSSSRASNHPKSTHRDRDSSPETSTHLLDFAGDSGSGDGTQPELYRGSSSESQCQPLSLPQHRINSSPEYELPIAISTLTALREPSSGNELIADESSSESLSSGFPDAPDDEETDASCTRYPPQVHDTENSTSSSVESHLVEQPTSESDIQQDMIAIGSSSEPEHDTIGKPEDPDAIGSSSVDAGDADDIMQNITRHNEMADDVDAIPTRVLNHEHKSHHREDGNPDHMDIDISILQRLGSQEEISFDEDIKDPNGISPHTSDDNRFSDLSDRVGQMQRGYITPDADNAEGSCTATETDHTSSGGSEDVVFQYGSKSKMAREEVLSVAIHDLKLTHKLTRAAVTDVTALVKSFANVSDHEAACWDYRTTKKWIRAKTGVEAVQYDCCRNSCMSFVMYPEKELCDYCELPRWKEISTSRAECLRTPFTMYEYIPVIHRLRLWYGDPKRAAVIESYRHQAELEDNMTDYWTSELFLELKAKGLFRSKTDLAFLLTTDGVQIFKVRTRFSIWPIALVCFNLPPTVRSKRQNMLSTGFIPGPKSPKNLDSFLFPLVKEFQVLQSGVTTLDGAIPSSLPRFEREFTLRAHLCLVGADMVAREKIMKVTGNRSYCYCESCLVQGIWNRGLYCPISPPTDAPPAAQRRKGSGYPWASWNREDLPMRNDQEFRHVAAQVARKGATKKQGSKYGVKGLSILSRLSSIDFPKSFPPDSMHLWFENVVPDLVKHWRGKYGVDIALLDPLEPSVNGFEADDESSDGEPPTKKRKVNQKTVKKRKPSTKPIPVKEPKVILTDDPYNIALNKWESMSRDIASSARTFPLVFGPLLRNFLEHISEMTAAEWQIFTFLLGPVYLKDILPDEDYNEFVSLVEGIQLSCDYVLNDGDLVEMNRRMLKFSDYYEKRYYRQEWGRLKACIPVFHQLLHVPQALRWAGPMYVYSQWAMERFCGTLAGMAKSRVATNQNISNTLVMLEQKNALVYAIDHGLPNSSDEDSDGNVHLSNFLAKQISRACPPDSQLQSLDLAQGSTAKMDTLLFSGPSRTRVLTAYERTCLKAFFLNEGRCGLPAAGAYQISDANLDMQADDVDIPKECRVYRAALFNTGLRGDPYPFKSTSSTARRETQTRSTLFVRFETLTLGGEERQNHFGEVFFFFIVVLTEGSPLAENYRLYTQSPVEIKEIVRQKERGQIREATADEVLLAYVREFPVCRDGRLLYRGGKGVMRVILGRDIHELIGLLIKGKKEYIVRRYSAFFS